MTQPDPAGVAELARSLGWSEDALEREHEEALNLLLDDEFEELTPQWRERVTERLRSSACERVLICHRCAHACLARFRPDDGACRCCGRSMQPGSAALLLALATDSDAPPRLLKSAPLGPGWTVSKARSAATPAADSIASDPENEDWELRLAQIKAERAAERKRREEEERERREAEARERKAEEERLRQEAEARARQEAEERARRAEEERRREEAEERERKAREERERKEAEARERKAKEERERKAREERARRAEEERRREEAEERERKAREERRLIEEERRRVEEERRRVEEERRRVEEERRVAAEAERARREEEARRRQEAEDRRRAEEAAAKRAAEEARRRAEEEERQRRLEAERRALKRLHALFDCLGGLETIKAKRALPPAREERETTESERSSRTIADLDAELADLDAELAALDAAFASDQAEDAPSPGPEQIDRVAERAATLADEAASAAVDAAEVAQRAAEVAARAAASPAAASVAADATRPDPTKGVVFALRLRGGRHDGAVIPLEAKVRLGTGRSNDLVLKEHGVGFKHAVFRRDGETGECSIQVLGKSATSLNGQSLTKGIHTLRAGDRVAIGRSTLVLCGSSPDERAASDPSTLTAEAPSAAAAADAPSATAGDAAALVGTSADASPEAPGIASEAFPEAPAEVEPALVPAGPITEVRFESGRLSGKVVSLLAGESLRVGTGRANDVVLKEHGVAFKHIVVARDLSGGATLEVLARGAVTLNGDAVRRGRHPLQAGDLVGVGLTTLALVGAMAPAQPRGEGAASSPAAGAGSLAPAHAPAGGALSVASLSALEALSSPSRRSSSSSTDEAPPPLEPAGPPEPLTVFVPGQRSMPGVVAELRPGRNLVGSARSNHLFLNLQGVSFKHAVLHWDPAMGLELENVDPDQETFVGGARVLSGERHRLREGDAVLLGQAELYVVSTSYVPPESKPAPLPEAAPEDVAVFESSALARATLGADICAETKTALADFVRRSEGLFELAELFPPRVQELAFATVRAEPLTELLAELEEDSSDARLHCERDALDFVRDMREVIKSYYLPEPIDDWITWDEEEQLFMAQRQDDSGMALVLRPWDMLVCLPRPVDASGPMIARAALRQLFAQDASRLVPDASRELREGIWHSIFESPKGLLGYRFEKIEVVTDGLIIAASLRPRFAIEPIRVLAGEDPIDDLLRLQQARVTSRSGPASLAPHVQPLPPGGRYGRTRIKPRGRHQLRR